jgi:NAD-dependent dihydropyrimidine dehydrogenase PreA subunit
MTGAFIGAFILAAVLILWMWIERWHLILPNTLPALKWLGFKRTVTGGWHAILYGRWIPQYIQTIIKLLPYLGPKGKKKLADGYHGKVITTEQSKAIVSIDRDIPLQDLGEQVIPYARARDIVLTASPDIMIVQCGCKIVSDEPCKKYEPPYYTCMLIGSPLTDWLYDHRPDTSRKITQDEALKLLEDFHQAGLVHSAWFKDVIKDQFYCICNCCDCCCLGFKAMGHGIRQLTSSGYVIEIDDQKCKGCNRCTEVCSFGAAKVVDGKAEINWESCHGCGVCTSKCSSDARKLILDERKGKPMDVRILK